MAKRALRWLLSLSILAAITFAAHALSINSTTAGFAYLLVVLILASTWGFFEAAVASIAATLALNFFFLPPVGTFTIADPQNWVALFSFLTTSPIASRLSTEAKRRALEAIERQQDVERLYTFSRAILLIESNDPFAAQLTRKLQEIFQLSAAVLYDRRTGEFHWAGPADVEGIEDQRPGPPPDHACPEAADRQCLEIFSSSDAAFDPRLRHRRHRGRGNHQPRAGDTSGGTEPHF